MVRTELYGAFSVRVHPRRLRSAVFHDSFRYEIRHFFLEEIGSVITLHELDAPTFTDIAK